MGALDVLMEAVGKSGHTEEVETATDVAASEFHLIGPKKCDLDSKNPNSPNPKKTPEEMIECHETFDQDDREAYNKAVGLRAAQIKTGAPCRSERLAEYDRLLRIGEELGKDCFMAELCE